VAILPLSHALDETVERPSPSAFDRRDDDPLDSPARSGANPIDRPGGCPRTLFDGGTGASPGCASFDEAFRVLLPRAKQVAYRILGDVFEAEDAAVEALARASTRWRRFAQLPDARRDAWVLRVTANVAYDELRRRIRRLRPLPMGSRPETQHGETTVDLRDAVIGALGGLPRRQKQVLTLRYILGLSEAEIATALRVSPGTVKTCASRGLSTLRVAGWGLRECCDANG
jgi:RNA polymerase sigma factor (sigma-70 family)